MKNDTFNAEIAKIDPPRCGCHPLVIRSRELEALLQDASLNDDQRERVLIYSMAARERLGLEFFIKIAPLTLARTAEAKPLAVMIKGIDNILSFARSSVLSWQSGLGHEVRLIHRPT